MSVKNATDLVDRIRQKFYRNRKEFEELNKYIHDTNTYLNISLKDIHRNTIFSTSRSCYENLCVKYEIDEYEISEEVKFLIIHFLAKNTNYSGAYIRIIFLQGRFLRKRLRPVYRRCFKCLANCWEFQIPKNAACVWVSICFKKLYDECCVSKKKKKPLNTFRRRRRRKTAKKNK